jgi:uncharacterized phage infection (PIP) family protein YhgE
MQLDTAETSSPEPGPPLEQAVESEPRDQAWGTFEETVKHIVRIPLEEIQQQVTRATQDLTGKVENLSRIQGSFEDDMRGELGELAIGLEELRRQSDTTSDSAARERAELHEAVTRLTERLDSTVVAMSTRFDAAAEALKQEVEKTASRLSMQIQQSRDELRAAQARELTSQIAGLSGLVHAVQTEVRTMEERTSTRQQSALASMQEAIGQELSVASGRSSDADQAVRRSLAHLRWTSYVLLVLLVTFAAVLIVITAGP